MHKKLKDLIEDIVRAEERALGARLNIEAFDFIVNTTCSFVERNINKFISGAIEHAESDFVRDVDHIPEALNEVYDLVNYLNAALIKTRNLDKRYES